MSSSPDQPSDVQQATCLESVNRISKLPVVEQSIQTAQNIYGKVKDYNSVTHWTLQTAEDTAHKAVEVAKPYATPVIKNFEGPIKKVDDVICTGLDYVETKLPAVKLPPKEIYNTTKDYVSSHVTPAVETAKSYAEPAYQTAKEYAGPAVQTARDVLEPAVEKARSVVEPMVEPIVENVKHRVDEILHRNQEAPESQQQEEQPQQQNPNEASPKKE